MLEFSVPSKSQAGLSYDVKAALHGRNIVITCTCEAAHNGQWCSHRLDLLTKSKSSHPDVAELQKWFPASQLPAILAEITKLEKEAAVVKAALSAAKKRLGRALVTP